MTIWNFDVPPQWPKRKKRKPTDSPILLNFDEVSPELQEVFRVAYQWIVEERRESLERSKRKKGLHHFNRHAPNVVIQPPPGYYAFLSEIEEAEVFDDRYDREGPTGPVTFFFQLIEKEWFERIKQELEAMKAWNRLLEILERYNFAAGFETAYRKLIATDAESRAFLYLIYLWYLARILQDDDPARVFVVEARLEPDNPLCRDLFAKRESEWFYIELADHLIPSPARVKFMELGLDPSEDTEPANRWVVPFRTYVLPSPLQQLLLMMHFPRSAPPELVPEPELDVQEVDEHAGEDLPEEDDVQSMMDLEHLRSAVRNVRSRTRDGIRRLLDAFANGGGPPLAFAYAGGSAAGSAPPAPPEPQQTPALYVGSNSGGAGGAQVVNPMVKGTGAGKNRQPFVGVIDVGQGNCNVLFNHAGKAFVYYDFGYKKNGRHPPRRASIPPCLCHNPLIIISHWDGDHFLLGRHNPRAFRLTWLGPQQHMGSGDLRESVARIFRAGGRFYLWERQDGHMVFPWGFVIRSEDPNHGQFEAKFKNNTGLVMYTCVKNGAGNRHAARNPAACPTVLSTQTPQQMANALQGSTHGEITRALQKALAWMRASFAASAARHAPGGADHAMVAVALAMGAEAGAAGHAQQAGEDAQIVAAARAAVAAERANPGDYRAAAVAAFAAGEAAAQAVAAANDAIFAAACVAAVAAGAQAQNVVVNAARHGRPVITAPIGGVIATAARKVVAAAPAGGDDAVDALVLVAGFRRTILRAGVANAPFAVNEIDNNGGDEESAAGAVAPAGTVSAKELKRIIVRSGDPIPAGAAPVIPNLQDNHPSTHPPTIPNERYVMSTGDAMIQYVPSQSFTPQPVMVGMVACHHGSNKADGVTLDEKHLPWAMNCAPTKSVANTQVAHTAASKAAASVAFLIAAPGGANAARAARQVAAALAGGGVTLKQAAAAAARAVFNNAVALNAITTAGNNAANVAAGAAQNAGAAAAAAVNVAIPTAGGVEPDANAMNAAANAILNAINAQAAIAVPPLSFVMAAYRAASGNAANAAEQTNFAAAVYAAVTAHEAVQAAGLALPTGGALGRLTNAETIAVVAAAAAAIGASRATGVVIDVPNAAATAALAGMADAGVCNAATHVHDLAGNASGVVAYPFGAGNSYGHPSPRAQAKYGAHGWRIARNTGAADSDVAVGWEKVGAYEGPLRGDNGTPGTLTRTVGCACNGVKRFTC